MLLVTVVDDNDNEEECLLPAELVPIKMSLYYLRRYSHLYSIPPPQHQRARVTLAFRDSDESNSAVCELLLRSGDRLRVVA